MGFLKVLYDCIEESRPNGSVLLTSQNTMYDAQGSFWSRKISGTLLNIWKGEKKYNKNCQSLVKDIDIKFCESRNYRKLNSVFHYNKYEELDESGKKYWLYWNRGASH